MKTLLLALLAITVTACSPAYAETRQVDDWEVEFSVDAFTDEQEVLAQTFSTSKKALMFIMCSGGEQVAAIIGDQFLGIDETGITYRFDDKKAVTDFYDANDNSLVIRDAAFIQGLIDHGKLIVRLYDYRHNSSGTYEFSLIGASDAIGLVECQ